MRLSPEDLIPADRKTVVPFTTRDGETWFAVHVRDCADGLVSVHPTREEAEASIRGERRMVEPLVVFGGLVR
jgi:hypothetical protein